MLFNKNFSINTSIADLETECKNNNNPYAYLWIARKALNLCEYEAGLKALAQSTYFSDDIDTQDGKIELLKSIYDEISKINSKQDTIVDSIHKLTYEVLRKLKENGDISGAKALVDYLEKDATEPELMQSCLDLIEKSEDLYDKIWLATYYADTNRLKSDSLLEEIISKAEDDIYLLTYAKGMYYFFHGVDNGFDTLFFENQKEFDNKNVFAIFRALQRKYLNGNFDKVNEKNYELILKAMKYQECLDQWQANLWNANNVYLIQLKYNDCLKSLESYSVEEIDKYISLFENKNVDLSPLKKRRDVLKVEIEKEKQEKEAEQKRQTEELKKKAKVATKRTMIIGGIAAVVLGGVFAYLNRTVPIDNDKYVTVSFEGLDGYAKPVVNIDYQAIMDDTGKYCDSDSITYTIDAENNLKNGDEITITFDDSQLKKEKIKLKKDKETVTVSDLKEGTPVDVFASLDVFFDGENGSAELVMKNDTSDYFLRNVEFTADKTSDLSNGDTITITASIDPSVITEEGKVPKESSKTYTISGLGKLVRDVNDLNEDDLKEYIRENLFPAIKATYESEDPYMVDKYTQTYEKTIVWPGDSGVIHIDDNFEILKIYAVYNPKGKVEYGDDKNANSLVYAFLKLTPSYQGKEDYNPKPFYITIRMSDMALNQNGKIINITESTDFSGYGYAYNSYTSEEKAYKDKIADYIEKGYKVTEK